MSKETIKYTNGEVTVHWKPALCIHNKQCWQGLPSVFKPRERPWVQPEGAVTTEIIAAVMACPSGALSHTLNAEESSQEAQDAAPSPPETPGVDADMKTLAINDPNGDGYAKIKVMPNGPFLVQGRTELLLPDGSRVQKVNNVALCRCGASKNKPYCDGTHVAIKWQG